MNHNSAYLIWNLFLLILCVNQVYTNTNVSETNNRNLSATKEASGDHDRSQNFYLPGENLPEYTTEKDTEITTNMELVWELRNSTVNYVADTPDALLDSPPSDLESISADTISDKIGELYLPTNYNKLEIPKSVTYIDSDKDPEPVEVTVYLSIRSISEIDEVNERISLEIDIVLSWLDGIIFETVKNNALAKRGYTENAGAVELEEKTLDPTFLTKIWRPDIYIDNLVEVKTPFLIASRPAKLVFNKRGFITYTSRLTVKLDCKLNFAFFPADTQKCDIILRSYSYNSSDLKLLWRKPEGVFLLDLYNDNFDVAVGDIRRFTLSSKLNEDRNKHDIYEVLQFTLYARRRLSYQLLQTYIPSMLYVAITWLCFLIPSRMIEVRIAISMTTLLTLTAMFASVRESTPVVSYIKAIDYWMVAGIWFVFMTLVEFSVLLWTDASKQNTEETPQNEEHIMPHENGKPDNKSEKRPSFRQKLKKEVLKRSTIIITFIEDYSFLTVLLICLTFNILYWSWLFIYSGYFLWKVDPMHNAVIEDHINEETITNELDPFS